MKVKLIASLGPSTGSYDSIRALLMEGVSGFRINRPMEMFLCGEIW